MAVEIRTRKVWSSGAEVSYDLEAFLGETKLFVPGATVTRDEIPFPRTPGQMRVSVAWSSSNSDKRIEDAEAQLAVMQEAVRLAHELEAGRES